MSDVKNSSLATDLVSYWELEEASGTRVDSHGSNDLADIDTVAQGTGKIGNCADMNGSSEKLRITNASQTGLDITDDISIAGWVKWDTQDNSSQYVIASKWHSISGGRSYLFFTQSGNLNFATSGSGNWTGNVFSEAKTFSTGTWYHLAATYDVSAGTMQLFVDGVQLGSDNTGMETSIYDGTADFTIGADHSTSYTDGQFDEVGVWNKALTSTEVTALYNSGDGIPYDAGGGGGGVVNPTLLGLGRI